jgi:hypothetical protein
MLEFELDIIYPVIEDAQLYLVTCAVTKALALADPDCEWSIEANFSRCGEKICVRLTPVE